MLSSGVKNLVSVYRENMVNTRMRLDHPPPQAQPLPPGSTETGCDCPNLLDPYPNTTTYTLRYGLEHYCKVCNTQLNSCKQTRIHVEGKKHEKRLVHLKFSIESVDLPTPPSIYQSSQYLASGSASGACTGASGVSPAPATSLPPVYNYPPPPTFQTPAYYYPTHSGLQSYPQNSSNGMGYTPDYGSPPPPGSVQVGVQQVNGVVSGQPQLMGGVIPQRGTIHHHATGGMMNGHMNGHVDHHGVMNGHGDHHGVMNGHGDHHGVMNGHTVMLNQNTSPPQHGVMSPSLTSGFSGSGDCKSTETCSLVSVASYNSNLVNNFQHQSGESSEGQTEGHSSINQTSYRYSVPEAAVRYGGGTNGINGNACFQTDQSTQQTSRYNLPPVAAGVRGVMFRDIAESGHSHPRSSGQTRSIKSRLRVRCEVCNQLFPSASVLQHHLIGTRHNKKVKALTVLHKLHQNGVQFRAHLHTGDIRCEVCDVSVNSSHQLQAHMSGHKHRIKCARQGIKATQTILSPITRLLTPASSTAPSSTPSEASAPVRSHSVLVGRPKFGSRPNLNQSTRKSMNSRSTRWSKLTSSGSSSKQLSNSSSKQQLIKSSSSNNKMSSSSALSAGGSSPRLHGKLTHMKLHSGRLPGSSFSKGKLSASSRSSRAAALKLSSAGGKLPGTAASSFIKTRKAIRQVRQHQAPEDQQLESTTESEETGCETSLPADICQPEAGPLDTSATDAEHSEPTADLNPVGTEPGTSEDLIAEATVDTTEVTGENNEFNCGGEKGEKEKGCSVSEPTTACSSENDNLLNVKTLAEECNIVQIKEESDVDVPESQHTEELQQPTTTTINNNNNNKSCNVDEEKDSSLNKKEAVVSRHLESAVGGTSRHLESSAVSGAAVPAVDQKPVSGHVHQHRYSQQRRGSGSSKSEPRSGVASAPRPTSVATTPSTPGCSSTTSTSSRSYGGSGASAQQHSEGAVSRRLMGPPPGALRRFESCYTLSRGEEQDSFGRATQGEIYWCDICHIRLNSKSQMSQHISSSKHRKRINATNAALNCRSEAYHYSSVGSTANPGAQQCFHGSSNTQERPCPHFTKDRVLRDIPMLNMFLQRLQQHQYFPPIRDEEELSRENTRC